MRTLFFILLIVVIILSGLYIKKRVSKSHDGSTEEEFVNNGIPTKWDTILPGKWKISEIASNEREQWDIDTEIEFDQNHRYTLHSIGKYFDLRYTGDNSLKTVAGGGASGFWLATSDSGFQLKGKNCEFSTSLNHLSDTKNVFQGCNYFSDVFFGIQSGLSIKTTIETLSRDTILIKGKNYSFDLEVYRLFTRVK